MSGYAIALKAFVHILFNDILLKFISTYFLWYNSILSYPLPIGIYPCG